MKYWSKDVPNLTLLPNGRHITLDFIADGKGFVGTDNGYLNNQLSIAVQNRMGGWSEIAPEVYQAALNSKKNSPPPTEAQLKRLQQKPWFRADRDLSLGRKAVAGSVGRKAIDIPPQPKPEPVRVPTPEEMKPRRGKMPQEATS